MEKEDIDLSTLGNIMTGQKSVLTLGLLLVAFLNTPVVCVRPADLEIVTLNGVAQFKVPDSIFDAPLYLTLYNQRIIHRDYCFRISRCEDDWFDVQVKPLTIRIVIKNPESLPAGSNRLDLKFAVDSVNDGLSAFPEKYLVRIHIQGPGSIIKEIKTKNVVEGFASFHIDAPSPERLFFVKDQHLSGIFCAAETWCEDRFFWRLHPTNRSTSISVTIDNLSSEDVQDYFFFSLNNGTIYQYNLSISTSQYSMSLSKCADFILFSEKYDLPWDSEYSRATANIFVLPPGRNISVNTCDMSVKEENMAYWTSESRESLWMGNSSSFLLATHNSVRLIMTFDDQKSKMGVFYLFFSSPERRKPPGSIYLREGKKGTIEARVPRFVSDMHVSTNSFLIGLGFRCSPIEPCANGMKWENLPLGSMTILKYHLDVSLEERLFRRSPVGKDYLELRMYFEDTSAGNIVEYYRLLHFPRGIDKHIVNMSTDVPESGEQMTYSIDVTWTEKLADYLFIFPTLLLPRTKCEWSEQCIDQFVFRKWKTFYKSLDARLDFNIHGTANLNNYAVFLTDEYQMDFRIYKFPPPPAASDPPSVTIAPSLTDPTVATPSDSTVVASSDSTAAVPSGPIVTIPSGPTVTTPSDSTVTTPDLSDNTFWKNSTIVLLAVVGGACLVVLVTVLTVNIMRSRKVRSRHALRNFIHRLKQCYELKWLHRPDAFILRRKQCSFIFLADFAIVALNGEEKLWIFCCKLVVLKYESVG
ncbi:hypothetical protein PoB_004412500 [Plakobranchus ocellatus]|uniref:CUB domain-containing protein n=1 Tax=Plakobranchus ocellatus TaxID=259542 RepID=A0AAV4BAJ1_9GAST|nr:hypothetical protein PoB_004412500 [Plakobranchus ocellatus]